jgi:hypothetical protein
MTRKTAAILASLAKQAAKIQEMLDEEANGRAVEEEGVRSRGQSGVLEVLAPGDDSG